MGENTIIMQVPIDVDFTVSFAGHGDIEGYQKIIQNIYSCKSYYKRVKLFLKQYDPPFREPITLNRFMAFLKSIIYLGILKKERTYYWRWGQTLS